MQFVKELNDYSIYEEGCCGNILFACAITSKGILVQRDLLSIEEAEDWILKNPLK